jgi:hypothetical protein
MPEGNTIHRLARQHTRDFGGKVVRARSPQGRFAREARRLDHRRFLRADAHGKHLFHLWEGGRIVHVHLGMAGGFYRYEGAAPRARPTVRLRLSTEALTVDLIGPPTCELIDEDGMRDPCEARSGSPPGRLGSRGRPRRSRKASEAADRRRAPRPARPGGRRQHLPQRSPLPDGHPSPAPGRPDFRGGVAATLGHAHFPPAPRRRGGDGDGRRGRGAAPARRVRALDRRRLLRLRDDGLPALRLPPARAASLGTPDVRVPLVSAAAAKAILNRKASHHPIP